MADNESVTCELAERNEANTFLIGVFTTIFIALIFQFIGRELLSPIAIIKSVIFGVFLQLCLLIGAKPLKSHAAALLVTFLGIVLLAQLPFSSLIFLGVSSGLIYAAARYKLLAISGVKVTALLAILALSSLYAIVIFESAARIDPFSDEKIRQFALNPDSLFHISMATMFKNYDMVSTGMNGLPVVHYHFFSHILYGSSATVLNIAPNQVYSYCNWIAFSPLLVTTLLRAVNAAFNQTKYGFLLSNILVLGGPFSKLFDFQWNSHWISESYLIGLILLSGIIHLLVEYKKHSPKYLAFVFSAAIPITTLAKISAGTVAAIIAALFTIIDSRWKPAKRMIVISWFILCFAPGYFAAKIKAMPRLEVKWAWNWFHKAIYSHLNFMEFLFVMFPLFFAAIPFMTILKHNSFPIKQHTFWSIALIAVSLLGFIACNLSIDSSGYYFANIHTFVALPFFAIIFSDIFSNAGALFYAPRLAKVFAHLLITYLICATGYFFIKNVPESTKIVLNVREQVKEHSNYVNLYYDKLRLISNDPDKTAMVYIPKTEHEFWGNFDDSYTPYAEFNCIRMPFYISILAGKPAILGLPDPKRNCYTFHRGYEVYSDSEFNDSAVADYPDDKLCEMVKAKRFKSFYRVKKDTPNQKIQCS